MRNILSTFQYELLSLSGAIAVLWTMLSPGYILTLDLIWAPHVPAEWDPMGINNAYPIFYVFHLLSLILPGWVGEKVLLLGLFFCLFYLPLRFLPWIEKKGARIFAAALYALNPYVYARMLAGQWLVLAGYALLPVFLYTLDRFTRERTIRSALYLGLSLALVGLFSVHLVYLALIVTAAWLATMQRVFSLRSTLYALLVFSFLSSYWLIPALMRTASAESHFDTAHFAAFAAAENGDVPVMLNVAALGGYWGEGSAWSLYFRWPQSEPLFWAAAGVVAVIILIGIGTALRRPQLRWAAVMMVGVGMMSYCTALGVAPTPLQGINEYLYAHMPLWSGLRDSQKIAGFLALAYVVFAGLGTEQILKVVAKKFEMRKEMSQKSAFVLSAALLVVAAICGRYQWGGFHGQLDPVSYPDSWYQAKALIDAAPASDKILVLPWHGYISLPFDHQLIVANPAPAFFGYDRVIVSKSIDAGSVHDVETDPRYRTLDALLSSTTSPTPATLGAEFDRLHVKYVLVLINSESQSRVNWTDVYSAVSGMVEHEQGRLLFEDKNILLARLPQNI